LSYSPWEDGNIKGLLNVILDFSKGSGIFYKYQTSKVNSVRVSCVEGSEGYSCWSAVVALCRSLVFLHCVEVDKVTIAVRE
jgi:hypothetical protein